MWRSYRPLKDVGDPGVRIDPIVVAGESAGIPSLPTSGGFDVDEFYLELNVPILADVSAAEDLSVSLAVRSSDYSTFGSETTASYGVYWKVVPDFVVRYNFSEGFRGKNSSIRQWNFKDYFP